MNRKTLYTLLFIACIAGYIWLYYNIFYPSTAFSSCIIKSVTGYSCPSCGTTRSVLALTKGNVFSALKINPLGVIIAGIMIILPFWIIRDVLTKKQSLLRAYQQTEYTLKTSSIKYVFIVLIIANWIWNIYKDL